MGFVQRVLSVVPDQPAPLLAPAPDATTDRTLCTIGRNGVCRGTAAGNRPSKQPRTAPVLFRNVARQIAGIVAHAPHLDHAFFAAAIEKKMPRRLYALALHSAPAVPKMVGAGSLDQDLRAFRRPGPLGIGANIAQGLLDQRLIARRSGFPKFLTAPV